MNTTLRRITLLQSHLNKHTLPTIGSSFSTATNMVNRSELKAEVQKNVKDNFVMVYSKSYCPVSRHLALLSSRRVADVVSMVTALQSYQDPLGIIEGKARRGKDLQGHRVRHIP
jgi:hypothetical protein